MSKQLNTRHAALLPSIAAALVALATSPASLADGTSAPTGAGNGAALLGGALPGGAVISARYATVMPVSGGPAVSTPIAGDGSFAFAGLAPGPYRLTLASVPKQTQGATFGEKVNAGLAAKHDVAKNPAPATDVSSPDATSKLDIHSGMPNRISMNVTVARQNRTIDVDGAPIEVAVDRDGSLVGRVAAL